MRPVVGLLVRPGVPTAVVGVLARLQRWADVRAASAPDGPFLTGHVATSPRAAGIERVVRRGRPLVVWVDGDDEVAAATALAGPATLFASAEPAVARALDAVVVADDDADTDLVPLSPFVRRRWRRRYGFPDDWVAVVAPPGASPTAGALAHDDPLVPTALALASAAVVADAGAARTGLALGCPLVVDPGSAALLGIVDGTHALITGQPLVGHDTTAGHGTRPASGADLARELAGSGDAVAAGLSRRARELYDERHDASGAIRRLADHLGVADASGEGLRPVAALDRALDRLHTPDHARVRYRARELLGDLVDGGAAP